MSIYILRPWHANWISNISLPTLMTSVILLHLHSNKGGIHPYTHSSSSSSTYLPSIYLLKEEDDDDDAL